LNTAPAARPWLAEFVLLAAVWGASFVFMRWGAVDFGPLATAFLRTLIASLVLLPLLLWAGHGSALRARWRAIFTVGLLNSGVPFALFSFAVLHITTGLSSILNATTPLWGALVAWVWLHDKPGRWRVLGLVVGFVGVAALSWEKASFKGDASGWAVLACLGATLCYGVAGSFTKRYLMGVPPLATATGSQIGAALGLALPAALTAPALHGGPLPGWQSWASIVALAVLCTALAYVLYFRLIERAGAPRALAVTFLIPVFAVAYGVLLLGETLTPWMLGCGAVIVLGTALATGLLKPRGP
jgi:drug/metabolite transporter (DMT)-like permease